MSSDGLRTLLQPLGGWGQLVDELLQLCGLDVIDLSLQKWQVSSELPFVYWIREALESQGGLEVA